LELELAVMLVRVLLELEVRVRPMVLKLAVMFESELFELERRKRPYCEFELAVI
jgi:hypothetical protein